MREANFVAFFCPIPILAVILVKTQILLCMILGDLRGEKKKYPVFEEAPHGHSPKVLFKRPAVIHGTLRLGIKYRCKKKDGNFK